MIKNAKQFNRLNFREQMDAVLNGTFLAGRLTDDHYIKLYNVHHFYVEVFFDDRNHLITRINAFHHTHYLTPYLESLEVAV